MNSLVGSNCSHKTIAIYLLGFFITIVEKEMGKCWRDGLSAGEAHDVQKS